MKGYTFTWGGVHLYMKGYTFCCGGIYFYLRGGACLWRVYGYYYEELYFYVRGILFAVEGYMGPYLKCSLLPKRNADYGNCKPRRVSEQRCSYISEIGVI